MPLDTLSLETVEASGTDGCVISVCADDLVKGLVVEVNDARL